MLWIQSPTSSQPKSSKYRLLPGKCKLKGHWLGFLPGSTPWGWMFEQNLGQKSSVHKGHGCPTSPQSHDCGRPEPACPLWLMTARHGHCEVLQFPRSKTNGRSYVYMNKNRQNKNSKRISWLVVTWDAIYMSRAIIVFRERTISRLAVCVYAIYTRRATTLFHKFTI